MNLDRIGKYRVVQRIGKGAMGEVYKAHDPMLNRYVAVKTIAPSLAALPDFRLRFQREAQSAAQLSHPNIVTVFDFGEEDGLTYMAMELLEGRDLKQVIRSRETHLGERLAIMDQLCEGLGFAHAKGVVHRDLKPGNVHVQPGGHVKILDFGLARLGESEMTKTGTVMGTPDYMSPEQVRGEKADARSDVFSLGAVFYELLSQHRPFEADSSHAVLFQILEQEPEPLRRRAPDVPLPIAAVVERALAKDPARRYSDAGEMGRALTSARDTMAGETIVAAGAADPASTLLRGGESTVLEPAPAYDDRGAVHGATALARSPARARSGPLPRTVRPDPTVAGGAATLGPAAGLPWRGVLLAGAGVVALGAVAGVVWLRGRTTAPSLPPAQVAREQVGILTETLITSQLELARADLAGRDYEAAARRAEDALKLSAGNREAREVLDLARQAQRQIETAVTEARAAFGRGDTAAASEALGRVMALDPRHPVIAELSSQLKEHFQRPAEEARTAATDARLAAERARATSLPAFAEGGRLSADAQGLFRRQEFTAAAQKFVESRNAFERAKREADEARLAAARPAPSTRPSPDAAFAASGVSSLPAARAGWASPSPLAATASPPGIANPAPSVAAAPPAAPSAAVPLPSPSASLSPPASLRADGDKAAVERVIADYARAIESQDIALFRSLKPDLTANEERALRESFKAIKSQVVGITYESVQLEGDRATVRVARQDTLNGRPMRPMNQTFRLVRSAGGWLIQSIGQ